MGLDVDPSEARSVLILGGRRGPDVPGRSHNVCLLSISRAAGVVCGSSRGGWKGGSVDCGADEGRNSGVVKVSAGMGCVALGGESDGISRAGGEAFSGKNAGALGFNETLEGKGVVSRRGGWGWGNSGTAFGGESVNGVFVAGGVGRIVGRGGKNEGGVCQDANPFGWWDCIVGSGGFPKEGGIELDTACPNTEEFWPPPKTDRDEAPPKTELVAKGLGVDTRTENAFLGGTGSRSCLEVASNGKGTDPPGTEEIC